MTDSQDAPARAGRVPGPEPLAVVRGWREDLAAMARPDPLLDLRDDHPGTLDVTRAHPSGMAQLLAGRTTALSALFREQGALSRARSSARDVRLAASQLLDAHGIDGCRLALGVVRARAVGTVGPVRISAPLLLRRAALVPRGAASDDDVVLGSDLVANPALLRWLASAGVHVTGEELVGLALGRHGIDPRPALALVERRAAHLDGLAVHARLVLGLFADVVPAMVAAVDDVAGRLAEHDLVAALAGDGPAAERLRACVRRTADADAAGTAAAVAEPAPPAVVDLDADSRRALAHVLAGDSLRVEAPPGTGATQLVAAAVAGAAARGWRTLLVCPQRHEVADVVQRLADAGLPGLVDDGSHRPGPLAATSAPDTAPDTAPGTPTGTPTGSDPDFSPVDVPAGPDAAASTPETDLRRRHDALHAPDTWWDVSLVDALRAVASLAASASRPGTSARMPLDGALRVRADRGGVGSQLVALAGLGGFDPSRDRGPWTGAAVRDVEHARRVQDAVRRAAATGLPAATTTSRQLAEAAGLTPPGTLAAAAEQVELLTEVQDTLSRFTRGVFERPVERMVAATAPAAERGGDAAAMGLLERRRWRREAQALLRPGVRSANLHAALGRAADQRRRWQALGGAGGWPLAPAGLGAAADAVALVRADLAVLEPVLAATEVGADLERVPVADLQRRLDRLAGTAELLPVVGEEAVLRARLRDVGLADLLADLRARHVPTERVEDELDLCWWRTVLEALLGRQSAQGAAELTGAGLARAVQHATDAAAAARETVAVSVPRGAAAGAAGGAPCRARGPYQPDPPGTGYDLVVLAGAHRTGTAEAAAALALAPRALVVGDPDGAAPTVPRLGQAEARDEPLTPRASVLADSASLLPTVRLRWQHRATAELAAVADAVAGPIASPGPDVLVAHAAGDVPDGVPDDVPGDLAAEVMADGSGDVPGPGPVRVPGPEGTAALRVEHVGDDDAGGAVDGEVATTVRLVLDHVVHRPQESLAVITMTRGHARAVADVLRAELPDHPAAARALARAATAPEPFVVTDCTRAEDAVRDAVLLTAGAVRRARDARGLGGGHPLGALDGADGAQQLLLAVTRARRRLTLVAGTGAGDLGGVRLHRPAGRALAALLSALPGAGADAEAQAAATGGTADPVPEVLLDDLAERLARRGADARRGAGPGEPDLLVTGPEQDPVAVVSDALPPAPGTTLFDRHVRVPQQLSRHGWRVVRVAAVDLFGDPEAVADRVTGPQ